MFVSITFWRKDKRLKSIYGKCSSAGDIAQVLLYRCCFLAIMIVACLWIVQPFILGFYVDGYDCYHLTLARFAGEVQNCGAAARLAVLVMTLLLVLYRCSQARLLVNSIVDDVLIHTVTGGDMTLPRLAWLNNIPLVGAKLYADGIACWIWAVALLWRKCDIYPGTTTTQFVG